MSKMIDIYVQEDDSSPCKTIEIDHFTGLDQLSYYNFLL